MMTGLFVFVLLLSATAAAPAVAHQHVFSSESSARPIQIDRAGDCAVTLRELSAVTISDVVIRSFDGSCRGYAEEPFVRTCVRPNALIEIAVNIAVAMPMSADVRSLIRVHSLTADWNAEFDQFSSVFAADEAAIVAEGAHPRLYVFRSVMTARKIGVYHVSIVAVNECGWTLTRTIHRQVEVTCADGVFCNGAETFANGNCVYGPPPCDDDDECTVDVCDEPLGVCTHELNTANVDCDEDGAICAGRRCDANCSAAVCGSDGCGALCGKCVDGAACVNGRCVSATYEYSCGRPRILNVSLTTSSLPFTTVEVINPATTVTANEVSPACIAVGVGGGNDYIYMFVVPFRGANVNVGIDAILRGRSNESIDTVLEVRKGRCYDAETMANNDSVCNDNGKPHGGVGSRITALLTPGLYYLIASTVQEYSPINGSTATQIILFPSVLSWQTPSHDRSMLLTVRFVDNYIPNCENKLCGFDEFGGECGQCAADEVCGIANECVQRECLPKCTNKSCGDDGCGRGGNCGICPAPSKCVLTGGYCVVNDDHCDHLRPQCAHCTRNKFCASDCQCRRVDEALPDLIVSTDRLIADLSVATFNFSSSSCSLVEKCVGGTGMRRLLRFTVAVVNQGRDDVVLPNPVTNPNHFFFSTCHHHFHYDHFAQYSLIDDSKTLAARGHKQAFCLEDSQRRHIGHDIACQPKYVCTSPGIQRGWEDLYDASLECQYLDITDVPAGVYTLRIEINPRRIILESDVTNNVVAIKVQIQPM